MSDTIEATREALRVKADRAFRNMLSAANGLAYDVTVRADRPNGPGHDKASPQLTRKLKAEYVEAMTANDAAWSELAEYRAAHA